MEDKMAAGVFGCARNYGWDGPFNLADYRWKALQDSSKYIYSGCITFQRKRKKERKPKYLPVCSSHLEPLKFAAQLQLNELTPSKQVPPLRHGRSAHSSISEKQKKLTLRSCSHRMRSRLVTRVTPRDILTFRLRVNRENDWNPEKQVFSYVQFLQKCLDFVLRTLDFSSPLETAEQLIRGR